MNNEILEVLDKHLKMYPLMQEEDIYKLVHQSFFGPAHYINDVSWANKYIKVEAESCEDENKNIIYIGGGYYRYPLINDEEYLDSVCDAFVKSANTFNENKDGFRELLDLVSKHITKKELKEKYLIGLGDIWKNDQKMIDYNMKNLAYVIPICKGNVFLEIGKQKIETEFWFGESDCGQGLSHDENSKRMKNVRDNFEDYFINENLSSVNRTIDTLKEIIKGSTYKKATHYTHYWKGPKDSPIHDWSFYDDYHNTKPNCKCEDLSIEDLKIILTGYQLFKEDFTKKLYTYLRKYGLTKLHIRSYWIDR